MLYIAENLKSHNFHRSDTQHLLLYTYNGTLTSSGGPILRVPILYVKMVRPNCGFWWYDYVGSPNHLSKDNFLRSSVLTVVFYRMGKMTESRVYGRPGSISNSKSDS